MGGGIAQGRRMEGRKSWSRTESSGVLVSTNVSCRNRAGGRLPTYHRYHMWNVLQHTLHSHYVLCAVSSRCICLCSGMRSDMDAFLVTQLFWMLVSYLANHPYLSGLFDNHSAVKAGPGFFMLSDRRWRFFRVSCQTDFCSFVVIVLVSVWRANLTALISLDAVFDLVNRVHMQVR